MPVYIYKCQECEEKIEVRHSMSEEPDFCSEVCECDEDSDIERDYGAESAEIKGTRTSDEQPTETGEVVEETIEEAREEVEKQKDKLKDTEYEP